MKIGSIKYLTREGVKSAWINRLMTVASVGVLVACMILIGVALLIRMNADKMLGELEQQNVIMVYFDDYNCALYGDKAEYKPETSEDGQTEKPDENGIYYGSYKIHNEEEASALCEKIKGIANVADVEYISSEQGLDDVKKNMPEGQEKYFEFLDEKDGNPLSAAARVSMLDLTLFEDTVSEIQSLEGVDSVLSQNELAFKIASINQSISVAGIWIIAILLLIALVIVSNTIRITMYNRKLEISIMKAVGATDAFVRLPFVVEGVLIGLVSAIISEFLLYFIYRGIIETIKSALEATTVISFSSAALMIFGIFAVIGVLAGTLGSVIMISKYLKREGSEFVAI